MNLLGFFKKQGILQVLPLDMSSKMDDIQYLLMYTPEFHHMTGFDICIDDFKQNLFGT